MIIASNMARGTEKLVRRNSRVNGEVLYGKEQNFRERNFSNFCLTEEISPVSSTRWNPAVDRIIFLAQLHFSKQFLHNVLPSIFKETLFTIAIMILRSELYL